MVELSYRQLMQRIKVLLADDSKTMREAVRMLVKQDKGMEVIGEAKNGKQAVAMVIKFRPAVVLMDISMPLLNGVQATCRILKAAPITKVIMFSMHSEESYILAAINSGAVGYLLKSSCAKNVCIAIREVQKGNTFFSPSIPRSLLSPKK